LFQIGGRLNDITSDSFLVSVSSAVFFYFISPPLFLFTPYADISVTMGGDQSPYPCKPFLEKGLDPKTS
ncbi:MAG: hypothetical protein IJ740_17350, partial [Ruminococcus sp.]|nr:hypothetical protein [Ruminococcus sp.]